MENNIADINYQEVMEYSLDPLIVHSQLKIIYVNGAAEKFFRAKKTEVIGASPLDIFKDTSKPAINKRISGAYSQPAEIIEETIYRMDGTPVDVELYCHPVKIGNTKAIQTYVRDVTEKKQHQKIQHEMNKQLDELASNVIPIIRGIGVLPLLGTINHNRVKILLELVPKNVQKQGIKHLIIDFSGIYEIDNLVLNYLFNIRNVLKLLGVACSLTGLRPPLAREAIELGINIDGVATFSDVKDALRYLSL